MSVPYYSTHTGAVIDAAVTSVAQLLTDVDAVESALATAESDIDDLETAILDVPLLRTSLDLLIEPDALTGGAAGALDAVTTTAKDAGARAVVVQSDFLSAYLLKAGTDAEASPSIIRPDDYAGTSNEKVWQRQGLLAARLGVGVALSDMAADLGAYVVRTTTATSGSAWGVFITHELNPAAESAGTFRGLQVNTRCASGNDQNFTGQVASAFLQGAALEDGDFAELRGAIGRVLHQGTGTLTLAVGLEGSIHRLTGAGTITGGTCVLAAVSRNAGTLTTVYHFRATHSGDADTVYGLFLPAPTSGTITDLWGVHQGDADAKNYFAGNVGIGTDEFPAVTGAVLALGDVTVAPTELATAASGGVLFSEAGVLKWFSVNGTITEVAG